MSYSHWDYFRVSLLPGIGPARGRGLPAHFSSMDELRHASEADICSVAGFKRKMARSIVDALREDRRSGSIEAITEKNAAWASKQDIAFWSYADAAYPEVLRSIYDPPLYLFARGELTDADSDAIAVVGTRNPSDYGRRCTEDYCRVFAREGLTVVSGLAMGIDTVAHRSTLRFGGRTIAVLGSGLLRVYPGCNRPLADAISGQGLLLSELPLDAKPDAPNFPRRNRIISGLSRALVVMESAETGGAMISASMALDQNRDVYAVPGPVYNPMSRGPHLLLSRSMAQIALSAEDILRDTLPARDAHPEAATVPAQLTLEEEQIVNLLGTQATHIDDIAAASGLPLSDLLVILLQLEFRGTIRQLPGKYFSAEHRHAK